jgi:outer membrane protein OmpA-like peptidoglycan-associated protein
LIIATALAAPAWAQEETEAPPADPAAEAPPADETAAPADDASAALAADSAAAPADEAPSEPTMQPRAMSLELGLFVGGFIADDEHEFYAAGHQHQPLRSLSPDFGARFGFYPLAFLGIEGEVGMIASETENGDTVDILELRGNLIAQYPARITPFLMGGVTRFSSSSDALGDDQDNDFHVGLGAKYFITERLQARADGRLYRSNRMRDGADENGDTNHFGFTIGLAWTLGGGSAGPGDKDGDGVSDPDDACPEEAGPAEAKGCPNADADGDGIDVPTDTCPDQAETANGFQDEDGCPDEVPDQDNDGIKGDADKCPTEAEDADQFQDEDGCPDPDNDADALLDSGDGCPNEAGPAENKGCPDADRDGDSIVDRLDNCPDEAGTAENQGCKAKQLVVITKDQLKILDKVYFKTGKAVIDKKSNKLLDNVAAVLASHPEIAKIRIEGHTDSVGADDRNKALSQQRAEAVAVYLSGKGVAAERMEPIGFGEEKPVADNATKAGQAENRRVEFNIVSDAAPAAP